MIIVGILALAASSAAIGVTPHGPLAQNAVDRLQPPSLTYWMGTDQFGRDVMSRIMVGTLASLRVSVIAVAIAALIGCTAGIVAGYFGGATDRLVGRLADTLFAFPAILLALAILVALGPGWLNTAIAISFVYTPIFIRVSRGPVLAVREADYVKAGQGLGFGSLRLMSRHILPNVMGPIFVQVTLALSWAVLTESSLSFLGFGTPPPEPSLGLMVSEARTLVSRAWWLLVFPAATITAAVIGLNMLGDALQHAVDPLRRLSGAGRVELPAAAQPR